MERPVDPGAGEAENVALPSMDIAPTAVDVDPSPEQLQPTAVVSDDDGDRPRCRICFEYETPTDKLLTLSCKCRGSLAHAHQRCADEWFLSRGTGACELCHHFAHHATPAICVTPEELDELRRLNAIRIRLLLLVVHLTAMCLIATLISAVASESQPWTVYARFPIGFASALIVGYPLRRFVIGHFEHHWKAAITTWSGLAMMWILLAGPVIALTVIF